MTRLTQDEAWAIWRLANSRSAGDLPERDQALVDSAETTLLRIRPRDGQDVIRMLDVVMNNLEAGPRCDGADLACLGRVRRWIAGHSADLRRAA